MRHSQPEWDAGMGKLGDLRCIGAFFSFKFRATGGSFFAFSLIVCLDAPAKSQTSSIQVDFT